MHELYKQRHERLDFVNDRLQKDGYSVKYKDLNDAIPEYYFATQHKLPLLKELIFSNYYQTSENNKMMRLFIFGGLELLIYKDINKFISIFFFMSFKFLFKICIETINYFKILKQFSPFHTAIEFFSFGNLNQLKFVWASLASRVLKRNCIFFTIYLDYAFATS